MSDLVDSHAGRVGQPPDVSESALRAREEGRGRDAARPAQIPLRGWRDIGHRVVRELWAGSIGTVASAVAFWGVLAMFPALAALVSIYGLIADPGDVHEQLSHVRGVLPREVHSILDDQLRSIVSHSDQALSRSLLGSIVGALWAASGGIGRLIAAINVTYEERDTRSFFALRALALLMTLGAIGVVSSVLFLIGVLPGLFAWAGLDDEMRTVIDVARWPVLALFVMSALAVLYRYAPARRPAKWRWVTLGSVIATALWLGATMLFLLYVGSIGHYNETYGALGGFVVLLLWLYIASFSVLLGAEINAEIEHQTARDSTAGDEERPLGQRGAKMADTVGVSVHGP